MNKTLDLLVHWQLWCIKTLLHPNIIGHSNDATQQTTIAIHQHHQQMHQHPTIATTAHATTSTHTTCWTDTSSPTHQCNIGCEDIASMQRAMECDCNCKQSTHHNCKLVNNHKHLPTTKSSANCINNNVNGMPKGCCLQSVSALQIVFAMWDCSFPVGKVISLWLASHC